MTILETKFPKKIGKYCRLETLAKSGKRLSCIDCNEVIYNTFSHGRAADDALSIHIFKKEKIQKN